MAAQKEKSGGVADEFFIGYRDYIPQTYRLPVLMGIVLIAVVFAVAAWIWVSQQKPFATATFELGKPTVLKGLVFQKPVPAIRVVSGRDFLGNQVYQTIPLINFGKFGASGLLMEYEQKIGKPLSEGEISLEGTLIYRDGKTLFELTKRSEALKGFSDDISLYDKSLRQFTTVSMGEAELSGEIVDPKCYFGVMKPGQGKPHRACASLCIRGGIPPVFVTIGENGEPNYFLLLGANGEMVNEKVLDYVAVPSRIRGKIIQADDWFIIYANPETDIHPIL
ncbi:MAG: hypothetical protein R3C61_28635 [Bacteroidia bacterium]